MYFDRETHRTMLRLAWAEPNRACRRRALVAALVILPLGWMVHSLAVALDRLLSPTLRATRVPD